MKVLRFLLILVVILFAGYLILCATSPATMEVERSTTINAPKALVWNTVVDLNNYDHYSPWKEQDPSIQSTITGEPGQVGQKSAWVSEKSGTGNMTLTSVDNYTKSYDMHFIEPWEGRAKGKAIVEDAEDGVKVTAHYSQEAGFFGRGMNTLFVKSMMGDMFERELQLLKEYVESGEAKMPAANISETTFAATKFATIRKEIPMSEMDAFFEENIGKLVGMAGDKATGVVHDITYKWDEENGVVDMAVAVPVSADVDGATMVDVPECSGYMTTLHGGYSGIYNAHMAISKYTMDKGLEGPLVIEEYKVMAPQETDSNKFVTNIYYLYK